MANKTNLQARCGWHCIENRFHYSSGVDSQVKSDEAAEPFWQSHAATCQITDLPSHSEIFTRQASLPSPSSARSATIVSSQNPWWHHSQWQQISLCTPIRLLWMINVSVQPKSMHMGFVTEWVARERRENMQTRRQVHTTSDLSKSVPSPYTSYIMSLDGWDD